jgi:phage repressor protein C with HTH and peptisase S24 domain
MPRRRLRLWPLGLYRVAGESMLPAYQPGNLLLGWRWFRPRAGQVVIARRAGRPLLKRIIRLQDNTVWLEGDNPAHSTDSRHFGPLSRSTLEARILIRLG